MVTHNRQSASGIPAEPWLDASHRSLSHMRHIPRFVPCTSVQGYRAAQNAFPRNAMFVELWATMCVRCTLHHDLFSPPRKPVLSPQRHKKLPDSPLTTALEAHLYLILSRPQRFSPESRLAVLPSVISRSGSDHVPVWYLAKVLYQLLLWVS